MNCFFTDNYVIPVKNNITKYYLFFILNQHCSTNE